MGFVEPALRRETVVIAGYASETLGYRIHREHGTPNWLILYTMGGAGRFEKTQCPQGSFLIVRPGVLQDYSVGSGVAHWEQLWVHVAFTGAFEGYADALVGHAPYRLFLDAPTECERWLHRCVNAPSKLHALHAIQGALLEIEIPRTDAAGIHAACLEFIRIHMSEDFGVNELAKGVGLSASRLTAVLRSQSTLSPRELIETERMKVASELLVMTNLPIQNIAIRIGLHSPFYFSLRFKKAFGVSPSEYRKLASTGA